MLIRGTCLDTPVVSGSIEFELSLGEVGGDRVTSKEDGTGLEATDVVLKQVKKRLVPQTPAVLGVLQVSTVHVSSETHVGLREVGPSEAMVGRLEDGEPRHTGPVIVLPSG